MREDWKEVKLSDLLEIERGGSPRPIKEYITTEEDGINWVKIGDTKDSNKYITKTQQKIKPSGLHKTRLVYPGDFVLSNSMSFGRPYILGIKGAIHDGWLVLRDQFDVLDKNFLYHILGSPIVFKQFSELAKGSTVKNLNIALVSEVKINLVSRPEQKAIVAKIEELFSDLDKGIADLKKAQEQLKVYRQAVLKKAFEGELTKEWREKQTNLPSADELLVEIKEERQKHFEQQVKEWKRAVKKWEANGKEGKKPSKPQKHKEVEELTKVELEELAELPTNWKWIKNNELMYYVTSGSRDWKKFYSDNKGTYFIRTQDIKTNKLELDGAAFVDLPDHVEGKRSLIEKGDLLMTITGANVGKVAHVDFDISEAYVSQSVALMKYVLKSFSPYLHYYFQSSATGAKFIGAMVYGVGRPVLSLDNMRDAPVSVCSFKEQRQIVQEIESRLSVCDKVEQSILESLEKAKALRQSILKKAFEGTLLSEDEISKCKAAKDYEPASVLLEKIKGEKKNKK